jgi:phosphoserine phosphatase
MSIPRVFLSSTYLDLRDVRDSVSTYLASRGFNITRFEHGGVFYDPNSPLDESCYREVKGAHLFILLIGGRYGSPSSSSSQIGKNYTSITRKELETAIEEGIPVFVFVRKEVDVELRTYLANPKKTRESVRYSSVDNTQIFQLLEQIYQRKKGNPIFSYNVGSDIVALLESQLSGLIAQALEDIRAKAASAKIGVNGFKLFFLRDQANLTLQKLAKKADVSSTLIGRLEQVNMSSTAGLGAHLFQSTSREIVEKLERALDCDGALSIGQADDFLSMFIQYYSVYKNRKGKKPSTFVENQIELFPTKVLVLDFEGTLTLREEDDLTTWERLWVALGYTVKDCSNHVSAFVNKQITHSEWCTLTCKKFKDKGIEDQHLEHVSNSLKLVPGVEDTLRKIHRSGISLFLISGSIRQLIRRSLGEIYDLFDEVHANDLIFDASGSLRNIRGTAYDFEGKGEFIKGVIARQQVSPLEVLFIGNSLNDVWASNAGARTLCVNPHFTNPNDARDWTYCIRKMKNFSEVLQYVGNIEAQ